MKRHINNHIVTIETESGNVKRIDGFKPFCTYSALKEGFVASYWVVTDLDIIKLEMYHNQDIVQLGAIKSALLDTDEAIEIALDMEHEYLAHSAEFTSLQGKRYNKNMHRWFIFCLHRELLGREI